MAYIPMYATVNGHPVAAVAINNVTYVEVNEADQYIGTYNNQFSNQVQTPVGTFNGVEINNRMYIAWNQIAENIKAKHIKNGWNFETQDNVVACVPFSVINDAILFNAYIDGKQTEMQLDTGAFEPLLNDKSSGLTNLGNIVVNGVGASTQGYKSEMTLDINGETFDNVKCVVDPSWTGNDLLGYSFFEDNGYSLYIDSKNMTLDIIK